MVKRSMQDDPVLKYRALSEMFRIFVIPDVKSRVAAGSIASSSLPIQIKQVRSIHSDSRNYVELNDEAQIVITAPATRDIQKDEPITLEDVNPDECYLEPPMVNGQPAAYFLCQFIFLDFFMSFNFLPNFPGVTDDELAKHNRYPLAALVQARDLLKKIQPIVILKQLAQHNWPPALGYYPHVLIHVHNNPSSISDSSFGDVVALTYNKDYWNKRLAFWKETKFFPDRLQYVNKAIDEYFEGDFISTIYVIVPQIEGIIKAYLTTAGVTPDRNFVTQLKNVVLSREILMFPRDVLDIIFGFIETGPLLWHTSLISDPGQEVNRHCIAHGLFTGFETRDMALKYLILLDALALVLLHDKMLTGKLF